VRRGRAANDTSSAALSLKRGDAGSHCEADDEVHDSGTTNGLKYLDGLSGLFAVQAGHGRVELAEAAAAQARKLAFFPIWSYAHPTAIELADRLAAEAPGDLK
jgi:adenosylmethionine-8-amino-7-oxononanoate aminotransferase